MDRIKSLQSVDGTFTVYAASRGNINFKWEGTETEAYDLLNSKRVKSDFERSLCRAYANDRMSDKQFLWMLYLASEELQEANFGSSITEGLGNLLRMIEPLQKAARNPKKRQRRNPMLYVFSEYDGLGILIKTSGPRSNYPGAARVYLSNTHPSYELPRVDDCVRVITVTPDGRVKLDTRESDWLDALMMMSDDLSNIVRDHGIHVGKCVLCGHQLSTEASLVNGYGEHCAKKYGLKYNRKAQLEGVAK